MIFEYGMVNFLICVNCVMRRIIPNVGLEACVCVFSRPSSHPERHISKATAS